MAQTLDSVQDTTSKETNNYLNRKLIYYLTITLLLAIFSRIAILDTTELVDPTETRYAIVAQLMVVLDDWVIPRIVMPDGIVPFMGKPPFHFWLTALSYKIFGFENFSSRLPSFIFSIICLIGIIIFGKIIKDIKFGILGALLTFSTTAFYLFSGASAVDMTLASCVVVSLLVFYLWYEKYISTILFFVLFCIFLSAGFLTKGPIAFIFTGLPIFALIASDKNYKLLFKPIWLIALLFIAAIVTPWFYVAESHYPGLVKYFFIQENLGRYFQKDFGNLYGGAPVSPYGTSWVMLFLNTLPWSPIGILLVAKKESRRILVEEFKNNSLFRFLIFSCFLPVIFLTFIRQIHSSYLICSIPFFCLSLVYLINNLKITTVLSHSLRIMTKGLFCFCSGLFVANLYLREDLLITFLIFIFCLFFVYFINKLIKPFQLNKNYADNLRLTLLSSCIFTITSFTILTFVASTSLNLKKSTKNIMYEILASKHAHAAKKENASVDSKQFRTIGVVSKNIFSHYWFAQKWEYENKDFFDIEYVSPDKLANYENDLLIDKKFAESSWDLFKDRYTKSKAIGKWLWLKRNNS